jgi:hypothetical protein
MKIEMVLCSAVLLIGVNGIHESLSFWKQKLASQNHSVYNNISLKIRNITSSSGFDKPHIFCHSSCPLIGFMTEEIYETSCPSQALIMGVSVSFQAFCWGSISQ